MSRWITDDVVKAISTVNGTSIERIDMGEDHTTQSVTVEVENSENTVYVRGFSTNTYLKTDNNVDVEMVEVSTGYSDGDMPNDPDYVIVHARVKAALMRMGHTVVNSLDPYF
jgi:hypothetical protein